MLEDEKWRMRLALGGVGLLQGVVLWIIQEWWPKETGAQVLPAAVAVWAICFGLTFHLVWSGKRNARLILFSSIIATVFAVITYWIWVQLRPEGGSDGARVGTFILAGPAALYAILPYVQIFQRTGRPRFPYTQLFLHSWNNFFLVSLGGFFVGVFWALIGLWAALFKLIGIEVFERIFFSNSFAWISIATAFGIGMALSKENERVIHTLRNIALSICRFLLPLLTIMALLFLACLPFTGLQPLWDTRHGAALLLSLAILEILFLNGVFQDGTERQPYPKLLRHGVEAAVVGLPIVAGLAVYATWLRFDQYGLTPDRFYAFLLTGIATLYGLGYAATVFLSRSVWMGGMRPVNLAVSIVIIFLALGTHTSLLDPLRLSAAQQYGRLVRGEVDASKFDYGLLRFELGHVGEAKLAEIKGLTNHPQYAEIRNQLRILGEATDQYAWRKLREQGHQEPLAAKDFVVYPEDSPVAEGLLEALSGDLKAEEVRQCQASKTCILLWLQLDQDPELEYVFLTKSLQATLYDRTPGNGWVGKSLARLEWGASSPARVLAAIRKGNVETFMPPYRNLRIGSNVWGVLRTK